MPYVELHCHTAFSFLDGASHPVEIAATAAEQGHEAIAVTDHDGLYGAMELAQATAPLGVRTIAGAELTLDDGHHLTLLCEDLTGYSNLCRLITRAHEGTRDRPADPLPPTVTLDDVARHAGGAVCLTRRARSGARAGRGDNHDPAPAGRAAQGRLRAFGRARLRVDLQRPFGRHDRRRNRHLVQLAERLGVPCVATGNVHAHARTRTLLQDTFVAVRTKATLDESEPLRRGNSSHVLAPPEAMAARFADHPGAVEESGRLAERLRFDLTSDLGYRYPGSEDGSADRRLAELSRGLPAERSGRPATMPEA